MNPSEKFNAALSKFDEANKQDPNTETYQGVEYPKELLYAQRMTEVLQRFDPDADEVVRLAARCQHICRWEIPRSAYEMNRVGYLNWRNELKRFHANKAGEIMKQVGYENETIEAVQFLLLKKQLKKNQLTQVLEDVICLVFLEYYFEGFSLKYSEEKLIDILKKTWKKMSEKGRNEALKLKLSEPAQRLVDKALSSS